MITETRKRVAGFVIFDKTTGKVLATLPQTISIGETVDGFTRAGYEVDWHWKEMEV
jgi:hypothetical protein